MPPKQKTVEIDEFPSQRICAADEVHERLLRTVPGYMETRNEIENRNLRVLEYGGATLRTGCTEIPVVVHVVHRNATENISDAQINSQIEILNADFRATNPDKASTPAAFAPLIGDARITFKLATLDPAGNPTTGITRTSSTNTSFNSDTDNVKHSSTGGEDAWPADRYLNIWTCGNLRTSSGQALLGYAQFPGGPADTDGVVILHSAFGNTGTATAPFDLGRTTTHEIGHWLDLRHIWGDDGTGCSGSDLVADTPNQGGPNFGAPTFPHVSCSNGPDGDMFMNYMDYVDDAAMVMFTAGQVTRMQTALDGPRSTIGTTSPCGKTIFKDGPKDPFKESIKDAPKDPIKEGPKDGVKDLPKDGAKDFVKDHPKEFAKDPLKDSIKEGPKDPIKDGVKDGGKDVVKDKPKESIKEFIKDFPDDLPKQLKDPQKNFVADTFPGPGPVIFPQVMGAQPFVIGGAVAGGAQGRGSDTDELLAAILQQLAQMNALLMQLLQR